MTATIGILGDGQLAKMLLPAAKKLGIEATALAKKDMVSLRALFSSVTHVLFENEFWNCALLSEAASGTKAEFTPRLEVIELVQDKLAQKILLNQLNIPTAPYQVLNLATEPRPTVLKWSRMGYDGKGVLVCDALTSPERIVEFFEDASDRGAQVYAEERIAFRRELAIVGVRSHTAEFVSYPLVVSEQENGICKKVYGPAVSLGVAPELESQAADWARKVAESLGLVGAFALEFFEDPVRGLLVNEIAPRVHNTGHYTLDACATSQFENHIRACLGLPLGPIKAAPVFAMLNLLGPGASTPPAATPDIHVHWYDKGEVRPRRKMGHLNAVGHSVDELPRLLSELERCDKVWMSHK